MNDTELLLAAVGDLEITRRHLLMQVAALQARVQELEEQLTKEEDARASE